MYYVDLQDKTGELLGVGKAFKTATEAAQHMALQDALYGDQGLVAVCWRDKERLHLKPMETHTALCDRLLQRVMDIQE